MDCDQDNAKIAFAHSLAPSLITQHANMSRPIQLAPWGELEADTTVAICPKGASQHVPGAEHSAAPGGDATTTASPLQNIVAFRSAKAASVTI